MNGISLLHKLAAQPSAAVLRNNSIQLKEGQLIRAKVLELFPGRQALLGIADKRLLAALDISLEKGSFYWFTVKEGRRTGVPVLSALKTEGAGALLPDILKNIPQELLKAHRSFVDGVVNRGLPATADELKAILNWLNEMPKADRPKAEEAALTVLNRSLPVSAGTLSSLYHAANEQSLFSSLKMLREELLEMPLRSNNANKLLELTDRLLSEDGYGDLSLGKRIKAAGYHLGMHEEAQWLKMLGKQEYVQRDAEHVKMLLHAFAKEQLGTGAGNLADHLLFKLAGQALLSQENGHLQYSLLQIPLSYQGFQGDATIQWTGSRKDNKQIDPSYCRILFLVNLPSLKETMIDVQIQNKAVSIFIHHGASAEPDYSNYKEELKQGLQELGYVLTSVKTSGRGKELEAGLLHSLTKVSRPFYRGVDLKI
ncbi:hypothetical protein GJU40_00150 [Bacillus lacus]|uniref:Flagellar hook-length control protein FliK n=1 Tax=Metabacillus lacus TaxID=1983721 RepID=A0A7X2IVK4_9BACI|nr:hypothetical protein [Metabacillus lacus]MRX70577.1 hypothetical protein [Metabacillus lacus]